MLEFELTDATSPVSTADNFSTEWHMSDIRCQASLMNVNSQLAEAYSAHVLSGNSRLLPYKSFVVTSSALPDSSDHDTSIARNFTRLCTVFQTFAQAPTTTEGM